MKKQPSNMIICPKAVSYSTELNIYFSTISYIAACVTKSPTPRFLFVSYLIYLWRYHAGCRSFWYKFAIPFGVKQHHRLVLRWWVLRLLSMHIAIDNVPVNHKLSSQNPCNRIIINQSTKLHRSIYCPVLLPSASLYLVVLQFIIKIIYF